MSTVETPILNGKIAVDSFDASSASVDEVVRSLKRVGGCVIRSFLSETDNTKLKDELRPYLEADSPWEGDFFPKQTRSKETRIPISS